MNLRLCALAASISLTGCVFTDASNETGGDFLDAHGVSVLPSEVRSFAMPVVSVEALPPEGVPGSHGTEDMVLGSLGRDSLRLVLGFDLSDTTAMSGALRISTDSLARLGLATKDKMPAMAVRARFVFLKDSLLLPALFAGIEPAALQTDGLSLDSLVDTSLTLPALDTAGDTASVALPGAVAAKVRQLVTDRKSGVWLVVLLDSRTGVDQRVRFTGTAWLGKKTHASADTATLGLGTFGGSRTWKAAGLRPKDSPIGVGWWASNGQRLRVRFDAASLRQALRTSYGIAPDTTGGFDNTFNVLQARLSAPFGKVQADVGPGRVKISSVAIVDSFANEILPVAFSGKSEQSRPIVLKPDQKRIVGLAVDPSLFAKQIPGGFHMRLEIDGDVAVLPTRLSLAYNTNSYALSRWFLPIGDSLEFSLYGQIRVRAKAVSATRMEVRRWFLASSPVIDDQHRTYDSLRNEAQLPRGGATKLIQEVRTPFTQLLNQVASPVEFDLSPAIQSDYSSRFVAEPATPKVFDSVKVVVRPLLSRNN